MQLPRLSRARTPVSAILGLSFVALCVLYVALGLSPSSYGCFLQSIGASNHGLIAGHCQPMRSDEYWVLTPYFQISVMNDFGQINLLSPYHEKLYSFFALPTLDWGLVFRPQVWLFHVMPPAQAYSAYWLIMMLSFVGSLYKLLRLAGLAPLLSILGALLVFFSQYIQLWWTMNAGIFAFIGWIGVALLANINLFQRFIAVAIAASVTMFALLYPPFLIAGGLAILIFCIAVRPVNFADWRFIAATLGGMGVALLLAGFYHWELIKLIGDTVYPGSRRSVGGGFSPIQFLGHFFPYLTTMGSEGSPVFTKGTNPIEIAVMGSWLPIMLAIFMKWRVIGRAASQHRFAMGTLMTGFVIMCLWMFTPSLNFLPSAFFFGFVPPQRMVYGIGLLILLSSIYFSSKLTLSLNSPRIVLFIVLVLLSWVLSSTIASFESSIVRGSFFSRLWDDISDLSVIPIFLVGFFIYRKIDNQHKETAVYLVLMVCVLTSILTFGRFNPIQRANVIFDKPVSPLIADLDAIESERNNGFFAIEGRYGAGLIGLGYPVLNHVLIYPQLDFFKKLYPNMDSDLFNSIFNRFAHIDIGSGIDSPYNQHADVINIPLRDVKGYRIRYGPPCEGNLPHDFNATRYLELNIDVKNAGADPREHYLKFGCAEKRNYGSISLIR